MKKYFFLLFFSKLSLFSISQELKNDPIHVGIDLGIASYAINDRLLNYYEYKATSFVPLNIHMYSLGKENIHLLFFHYNKQMFSLSGFDDMYNYNKVRLYDFKLNYEYDRRITSFGTNLDFYLGMSYAFCGSDINEQYQSKFWSYSSSQYSYDISHNFLINSLIRYRMLKGSLIFRMAC
jgi:hypothetical protein